ncbi:MAG TPA: hypothetical protein VGL93_08090 [Streptosporangiaceae bacterium]|jgi:hypothetical protein
MDPYELAQRTYALSEHYRTRLNTTAHRHVDLSVNVGEWDEALAILVAALRNAHTPITTEERQELTDLMTALEMPTSHLNEIPASDK